MIARCSPNISANAVAVMIHTLSFIAGFPLCADAEMQVRQNIELHNFWMHCGNAGILADNPISLSGRRTLCDTQRTGPNG